MKSKDAVLIMYATISLEEAQCGACNHGRPQGEMVICSMCQEKLSMLKILRWVLEDV
ncbi:MAG: hypothetical protein KAV87_68495 [Desulfobacteraceae bacterium]|nr:hypothetical protein [Desulfobacteraceae bacterium]